MMNVTYCWTVVPFRPLILIAGLDFSALFVDTFIDSFLGQGWVVHCLHMEC